MSDSIFGPRPGTEPVDVTPPPDRDDESPRPRSRRRTIALGAVAAVGLVAVGGLGWFGSGILREKDATLATPERIGTFVRDDSERAKSTADDLRSAFEAGIDLDKSVGAVYTDPASANRSVLLFGGTTLLWSPEKDLDTLFGLMADDAGDVTDVRELEPGDLGGVLKCGKTTADGSDISVCGWADHGSVAIGLFPGRGQDEAGTLLRDVRAAVQSRG
jgi:hypothetical protein